MAFSSSNLQLIHVGFNGTGPKVFLHSSTEAHAAIEATGYFANGKRFGMTTGDLLMNLAVSSDGSSAATMHIVSASTGAIAATEATAAAHRQAYNVSVSVGSTG